MALLLLMLNLLTPSLLSGGVSSTGSFLGEGSLYVSSSPNGTLSFLVESMGHLEFSRIVVAMNLSAPAAVGNATTYRHWDRWQNASDTVAATFNLTSPSFVLNVSAWYLPGSVGGGSNAPAATIGTFVFQLSGSGTALQATVTPIYPLLGNGALPDGGTVFHWSYDVLPQGIPLAQPPASATGPGPTALSVAEGPA